MPTEREKGIAVNRYSAFSPFAKINTTTTANKRHDSTDKRNCYCVRERIVCFSRIGKKKKISLISIDKYELAWFFKIDGEKYIYIYFYLFRVIMDVGRFFFFFCLFEKNSIHSSNFLCEFLKDFSLQFFIKNIIEMIFYTTKYI